MRKMCLTGMATLRLWEQFDVCTCTSVKCFIPKRKFISKHTFKHCIYLPTGKLSAVFFMYMYAN